MIKPDKILMIQSLGLGDLCFALPVVKTLKRAYPEASISFLTNKQNQSILQMVPEVSEILTYEKTPRSLMEVVKTVRDRQFCKVFVLNPILKGSLIAWISGAPVRVGYLRDFERKQSMFGFGRLLLSHGYCPRDQKMHEVDRYLELLENFGLKTLESDRIPSLSETGSFKKNSEKLSRLKAELKEPFCAINLGAGWKMKRWPEDRIEGLAKRLIRDYSVRIVFLGGDGEKALGEKLSKTIGGQVRDFCGLLSLSETAFVLKEAKIFVTCDTGLLHMAAALKISTVALFGPGDPEKFYPRSESVSVLYHKMPCSPCKFQYTNKCQKNLCMQEIHIEEVMGEIAKKLGPGKASGVSEDFGSRFTGTRKVLYLQSTSEVGGTDVTLLRTLQALNKKMYEPHVLISKEGPFVDDYRKLGCKIHMAPWMKKITRRRGAAYVLSYLFSYLPGVLEMARVIRREKIDIVHTNTIHNPYGFLAAKIAGAKHVWHIREIVVQSKWVRAIEVTLVKLFSDKFIVMDNAIGEAFLSPNHGFPKNIVKLYDGVNLDQFSPKTSGQRIRKELGISQEAALVGIVCRLDPWKGLDVFLSAAKKVNEKDPKVCFLICGGEIEGHEGYEASLKEKAKSLGLEAVIYFTGWRYFGKDIPEVYAALNVSVQCPRYPEPYGLANVEAMASGVPHVSINQGGPLELCGDGTTGFLVPVDNPAEIARAILKLTQNPNLAESMGKAGRQRAERFFDYQKCTRELEKIYFEAMKSL